MAHGWPHRLVYVIRAKPLASLTSVAKMHPPSISSSGCAEFLVAANQAFPPAAEWVPGFPARIPLSPQTTALAAKIMPEAIALMKVDYDRMVVLATTEGMDPVLMTLGPAVFGSERMLLPRHLRVVCVSACFLAATFFRRT